MKCLIDMNKIFSGSVVLMSLALINCGGTMESQTLASNSQSGTKSAAVTSDSLRSSPTSNGAPVVIAGFLGINSEGTAPAAPSTDETPTCAQKASMINDIDNALAAYYEDDKKYNDFCNAIVWAGVAPKNYVSPNVAPGIAQGPGVTDSLDGKTVLRSDLYFGHDVAAAFRQGFRDGVVYPLPSLLQNIPSVTQALADYRAAFNAMPTFSGPPGQHITGEPQHTMELPDANALENEKSALQSGSCE